MNIIVFFREPIAGQVKTRLGQKIGYSKAAKIYERLLYYNFDLIYAINKLKLNIFPYIAEKPSSEFAHQFEEKYSKINIQMGIDLGERMNHALEMTHIKIPIPTVIIGSDYLDLNEEIIFASATALSKSEVVIGPAKDGGYYLIGLNKPNPLVFLNRTWSHERVFKEQRDVCIKLGLSIQLLSEGNDLDTDHDLKTLAFQNPSLFKKILK